MILKGFLTVHFVSTKDNVADMLTKALGQEDFRRHRPKLLSGHDGVLPPHNPVPRNYVEVAVPAVLDAAWLLEEPCAGHL